MRGCKLIAPWGYLKVCAPNNANSDKPRTQDSNGFIGFAELGFEMFGAANRCDCSGMRARTKPGLMLRRSAVRPDTNGVSLPWLSAS
jgi:hypothetical protein